MRRAKLGDVYYTKLPNGYKLYQWAYTIPRHGKFIRVFDGLYDTLPENVLEIVEGAHSYITEFHASRAYRIGLAQLIGNYPIPEKYPFPEYALWFWKDQKDEIFSIWLNPWNIGKDTEQRELLTFPVSSIRELPAEYRDIKLLNTHLSPTSLLFMFDYNFNLLDLKRFYPEVVLGEKWEEKLQVYTDMVEDLLQKDKENREKVKGQDTRDGSRTGH